MFCTQNVCVGAFVVLRRVNPRPNRFQSLQMNNQRRGRISFPPLKQQPSASSHPPMKTQRRLQEAVNKGEAVLLRPAGQPALALRDADRPNAHAVRTCMPRNADNYSTAAAFFIAPESCTAPLRRLLDPTKRYKHLLFLFFFP